MGGIMHSSAIITDLKKRRLMLRVTQEHLAALSGIGIRTIKEIESGTGNPTLETLFRIADVLGMEIKLDVRNSLN